MTEKHSTVNIDYKNINVKMRERATDYNVYNKENYKYTMCTTNTVTIAYIIYYTIIQAYYLHFSSHCSLILLKKVV